VPPLTSWVAFTGTGKTAAMFSGHRQIALV